MALGLRSRAAGESPPDARTESWKAHRIDDPDFKRLLASASECPLRAQRSIARGSAAREEAHEHRDEGRADHGPEHGDRATAHRDKEWLRCADRVGDVPAQHGTDQANDGRDNESAQRTSGERLTDETAY